MPQVRPSIRFARRLIAWGVLLVTSYILFFGQGSSIQSAEATSTSVKSTASKNYTYISVQSGDSLWSIAEQYSTGGDLRDFIQEIVALNNLQDSVVEAGMRLAIPKS
jgi:LysM repeat protein